MRRYISIRTPARGVTDKDGDIVFNQKISIRTPARGVTDIILRFRAEDLDFNSRPRAGGDEDARRQDRQHAISIRTPARGVTPPPPGADADTIFQFAPPRGG